MLALSTRCVLRTYEDKWLPWYVTCWCDPKIVAEAMQTDSTLFFALEIIVSKQTGISHMYYKNWVLWKEFIKVYPKIYLWKAIPFSRNLYSLGLEVVWSYISVWSLAVVYCGNIIMGCAFVIMWCGLMVTCCVSIMMVFFWRAVFIIK